MIRHFGIFLGLCLLASCSVFKGESPPKREFRGVWIATVANIDWPASGTDPWEKQKADFTSLLAYYKALNFNAVIVQIRTAGDAFYPSGLAPWSKYLTGIQGVAPKTTEDPLKWMIAESQKHGMEFHGWMNPYRATFDRDTTQLDSSHTFYRNRDWIIPYGTRYYLDPGNPAVQTHMDSIVTEVVRNYAVDGIHFDDYFYPYTLKGEVFNDSTSYRQYNRDSLDKAQWRRANIDSLIKQTYATIKSIKPWVKFGVSPFGVWKNAATDPRGSATRAGQTTFDDLFADPVNWMDNHWLDYIAPQLYWSMDFPPASYRILAHWWSETTGNTPIYIGHAAYKIRNNSDSAWDRRKELSRQIELARALPGVKGNVMYNATALYKNQPDIAAMLYRRHYKYPALTPAVAVPAKSMLPPQRFTMQDISPYALEMHLVDPAPDIDKVLIFGSRIKKRASAGDMRKLKGIIPINADGSAVINRGDLGRSPYFTIVFMDRYGRESLPTIRSAAEFLNHGTER